MKQLDTDVLVVGGGTSGVTAAIAAADGGAKVLLVDCGGGIGGVGTHSGIHVYYLGLHVGMQPSMDQQTKHIADGMGSKAKGFHPEAKKVVLQELIAASGVNVLYHCIPVEVEKERQRVRAVIFESPEETIRVTAKVTLDSTGNGDVAALAGAAYTGGREWDGIYHVYSTPPRVMNDKGMLLIQNFDAGWAESTSARDVSRAFLDGRKLLWKLKNERDNIFMANTNVFGAREGRHIQGEYTLTMDDLIMDRRFDDVVMKCYSHYDNHGNDMANESRFTQIWSSVMGAWIHKIGGDVPYRTFVPAEIDGLLIACRALSMDHDTSSVFRMQPDMHAAGEVAGAAAALCCASDCEPRYLDIDKLQRRMIERGVITEADLTRPSAPWVTLDGESRESGYWTLENVHRPDVIQRLIDKLGTAEEGSAQWWLWKAGNAAVPDLRTVLAGSDGLRRRGIAIALAMQNDSSGVPYLRQSVQDQDEDVLREKHVPPHWIASLLALQGLKDTGCVESLLENLPPKKPTARLPAFAHILYSLHYFIEIAGLLPAPAKAAVIQKVHELLALPDLGTDWDVKSITNVSIRWNIELTGAYLLVLLGDPQGGRILEAYLDDDRVFVQNMADILIKRLVCASLEADGKVGQQ